MAETTARQFLIATLILGAIIGGSFALIGLALPEENTDFTGDGGYNKTFDKFQDVRSNTDTVTDKIRDAEPSSGILGILNGLIQASWGSLKALWGSMDIMISLLGDLSSTFGIPIWFTGLLISILTVVIAFAVIGAIFKWHI